MQVTIAGQGDRGMGGRHSQSYLYMWRRGPGNMQPFRKRHTGAGGAAQKEENSTQVLPGMVMVFLGFIMFLSGFIMTMFGYVGPDRFSDATKPIKIVGPAFVGVGIALVIGGCIICAVVSARNQKENPEGEALKNGSPHQAQHQPQQSQQKHQPPQQQQHHQHQHHQHQHHTRSTPASPSDVEAASKYQYHVVKKSRTPPQINVTSETTPPLRHAATNNTRPVTTSVAKRYGQLLAFYE